MKKNKKKGGGARTAAEPLMGLAFTIAPRGGVPVEVSSTPLMFAVADEFADRLRFTGGHTEEWLEQKIEHAVYMQAAQAEGLFPAEKPISLESLAEFMSLCTVGEAEADPQ